MDSVIDFLFGRVDPSPGEALSVPDWLPMKVLIKLIDCKRRETTEI